MKDSLAQRLLGEVMAWTPEEMAAESQVLRAMALLKYDEYQKFVPGRRFIESLAVWLQQFAPEDRPVAYQFVKNRIIFISNAELNHLVNTTFPDIIRPYLLNETANKIGVDHSLVKRLASCREYKQALRSCLYLGLSDGARMDIFRRSAPDEINHEQVYTTYEITAEKANGMLGWLRKDASPDAVFEYLFLVDDFSGSGSSYVRRDSDGNFTGKIHKVLNAIETEGSTLSRLLSPNLSIAIVLYLATHQASETLSASMAQRLEGSNFKYTIRVTQQLMEDVVLTEARDAEFIDLLKKHYDKQIETEHTGEVLLGYKNCALPLVLNHNTPNNSVYLLWADSTSCVALFPRVSRHKREL